MGSDPRYGRLTGRLHLMTDGDRDARNSSQAAGTGQSLGEDFTRQDVERQLDLFLHGLLREGYVQSSGAVVRQIRFRQGRDHGDGSPLPVAGPHLRRFRAHPILALPRARQERVRVRIGNQPSRAREHHGRRRQARRVSAGMAGLFSERERFRCRHRQIDSVRGGADPDVSCRPDLEGIGRRDVERRSRPPTSI